MDWRNYKHLPQIKNLPLNEQISNYNNYIENISFIGFQGGGPRNIDLASLQIGDIYGGGIVFYNENNLLLIAEETDISNSYRAGTVVFAASANGYGDGFYNTNVIVEQTPGEDNAFHLVYNSTNGGYNDWYVPSLDELLTLVTNLRIDREIGNIQNGPYMASNWKVYTPRCYYGVYGEDPIMFPPGSIYYPSRACANGNISFHIRAIRKVNY